MQDIWLKAKKVKNKIISKKRETNIIYYIRSFFEVSDIKINNNNSKIVNYNQLKELEKYNDIILIDVRSRQEFFESHINGAINIPLMNIKKYNFDKNQAIILYCNAGIRSLKAKKILESKGYQNVYILE